MIKEKIEEELEIGFEMFRNSLENCQSIPVLTIFIKSNYETLLLYPADNEKFADFTERLKGLSRDYNPYIIVGCDPVNEKDHDGVVITVHVESKTDRCFYHKRGNHPSEGWEETFDFIVGD
jgi:hypothetical protein